MLGFIFYSDVALLIRVPQPPQVPGTYYIINSVLSPAGEKLAASIQNSYGNVIVTPLTNSRLQQVRLDNSSHILSSVSLDFVVDDLKCRAKLGDSAYHPNLHRCKSTR